jgi:hypothetical protein
MTETLKLAFILAAAMGASPAMADCDAYLTPKERAPCEQLHARLNAYYTHDNARASAMRNLSLRSGPWACVIQDAYGDNPAYQDCGFGYGK